MKRDEFLQPRKGGAKQAADKQAAKKRSRKLADSLKRNTKPLSLDELRECGLLGLWVSAAGLRDEAAELVAEHPECSEAIARAYEIGYMVAELQNTVIRDVEANRGRREALKERTGEVAPHLTRCHSVAFGLWKDGQRDAKEMLTRIVTILGKERKAGRLGSDQDVVSAKQLQRWIDRWGQ